MSLRNDVEKYLESEPAFRERSKKDNGIANLLLHEYPVLQHIQRSVLVAICQDYTTMDRAWRQILEQRPELRGTDYEKKVELEEKKLADLGYNPGQKPIID